MNSEENSISIINRSGGTVTGENKNALPIKLINNLQALKPFFAGFFVAIALAFLLVFIVKSQVVVLNDAEASQTYTEYKLQ